MPNSSNVTGMSTSNTKTPGPLDNDEMLLVLQQSLTKKRVLIIDRHTQARDALRLMLGALGVTAVHGAGNSAEVLRQVRLTLLKILAHEGPVFGASSRECGNYRSLSLASAKTEAQRYLSELDARPVTFKYEE